MREDKDRSDEKLVDTMLSIKIDKLRAYLQNTPAANLVEEKIEKTAISIRAVLTNYVKAIRYLQGIEKNGEPFTIRDWMRGVREDRPNGWLFISSNADTHASLKPVISMWLSIAIRGLLAVGENRNRRVDFRRRAPHAAQAAGLVENLRRRIKLVVVMCLVFSPCAQLERHLWRQKPCHPPLFDVMNTRAFFRSPSRRCRLLPVKLARRKSSRLASSTPTVLTPVRDGVSTGKEKGRKRWSVTPIFGLPRTILLYHAARAVSGREAGPEISARRKIAEGFLPRTLDARVDALTQCVTWGERGKLKGSLAGTFPPDAPASRPASAIHMVNAPEPIGQPAPANATVSPAQASAADNESGSGATRQNGRPPVLRSDRTVDQTKSSRRPLLPQQHPLPCRQLRRDRQELAQRSRRNRDRTCCRRRGQGTASSRDAAERMTQADEQTQRDMQRREVNINHSHRWWEDVENWRTSDDVDWLR